MTATATLYTSFGFAVAADGWQLLEDEPYSEITAASKIQNVQKIFEFTGRNLVAAYTLRGQVLTEDHSFSVSAILGEYAAALVDTRFKTFSSFVDALSARLEGAVLQAKRAGTLQQYLATELSFIGYFRGEPSWIDVQFHPYLNRFGSLREVFTQPIYHGRCFVSGSSIVQQLIQDEDPRFPEVYKLFAPNMSLQNAETIVKGYVDGCCLPQALELDPENCRGIGGDVHVATVSAPVNISTPVGSSWLSQLRAAVRPTLRITDSAFQWAIPPQNRMTLLKGKTK